MTEAKPDDLKRTIALNRRSLTEFVDYTIRRRKATSYSTSFSVEWRKIDFRL